MLFDDIGYVEQLQGWIVGELRNDILFSAVEESLEENMGFFGIDSDEIRQFLAHDFLEQQEFLLVFDLALCEIQFHPFEHEISHYFIR